jgi:hypothetical protein
MAISDTQKTDFLWKKLIYGVTETNITGKGGANETIGSPLPTYAANIWSQPVPVPAPNATGSIVQYYGSSTAVRCMKDPTITSGATWLATSTYNNQATRIGDWVPPSIDPGYLVEVYSGNPSSGGTKLNQGASGFEWVFDYQAGVLHFPNGVPGGLSDLYIVGHRYIGGKGLGGGGVNVKDDQVVYEGEAVESGNYTFTNFFAYVPQADTVTVYFNGVRLNDTDFSTTSKNLVINMDNLPYDLEAGDCISARYAWAG